MHVGRTPSVGCIEDATAGYSGAMSDPSSAVQEQLEAYNAHDLERFLSVYSDDVVVYRMPSSEPALAGKPAFSDFYANNRFNNPRLHAHLLSRMAFGNKVIDHERIDGLPGSPIEAAAVYEISDGRIHKVWFFYGS
jgi:hypothetical protein